MKIAIENSTWNNIGDAFYQTSIFEIFKSCFPDDDIYQFDGPISRAFRLRGFGRNAFDVRNWVDADHYVISGPILGRAFVDEYIPFLSNLKARGKTYSILSAHGRSDTNTKRQIIEFISEFPPVALHTREENTFSQFKNYANISYNGCCFAFFASYLTGRQRIIPKKPYICCSYHSMPEPNMAFEMDSNGKIDVDSVSVKYKPSLLPWRVARNIDFLTTVKKSIGGLEVIRPIHGFYPMPHLSFGRPNSYITYNPLNFISIYAQCEMVFTDRVHAAVVGLSFGKPAHVIRVDDRFELFSRLGVERAASGVLTLERSKIEIALLETRTWLTDIFRPALDTAVSRYTAHGTRQDDAI